MQPLEDYKLCIICDTKYIVHIKYKDCNKICPRCRKYKPLKVINQHEGQKGGYDTSDKRGQIGGHIE